MASKGSFQTSVSNTKSITFIFPSVSIFPRVICLEIRFALYSYKVCSSQWKPRDASRWPEFRFAISTQNQRRQHWQKATAPFSWCHFCLQLSFQNSCVSAVRATDMLGNAQPCPRPWSRKTQEKISCDSSAGCSLCSWSAGAQRGKLRGFLGTCALFPAFSSCSHHKTTCKSVQDQTRGHPSRGGWGEASFSTNGHASPSTRARHGKGCSAAPSAWTRFSQGGTQTSSYPLFMPSPCYLNSHQIPKCWWEQWLGHGCPTCNRHAWSERFQSLYHSLLSSSQVQLMFKCFCLFFLLRGRSKSRGVMGSSYPTDEQWVVHSRSLHWDPT